MSSEEPAGSVPYFDAVSEAYAQRYDEKSPGGYAFRVRKQRLLELLHEDGGKLLDVGCGPGVMVEDLLRLGYELWGMDAAPSMIDECRKNFGRVEQAHFAVGNATHIEFPNESFDTVICMGVIDHVEEDELAIKEMLRVLRNQGTLLIAFPNRYSPWGWWRNFMFYPALRRIRPLYFGLRGRPQPPALSSRARLYSEKSARKLVKRYKGQVTDVVYYNFNQFLSPLAEIFPHLTVSVTRRLERYRSGSLRWLGNGFILKATKTQIG